MKNLFGKVLVGAAGLVMAFGLNAFAANTIVLDTPKADKETGKVTISGTITGDAAESTILVVPGDVKTLVELKDTQIKYIDQETAASGAFSYEFVLEVGTTYNVYCGGTDIVSPQQDVIDLTNAAGTFKIIGKVTLSAEGADVTKVTATATAGTEKKEATADAKGEYAIEVAPGTYEVVVGRAGYLYRTFKDVQVVDKDYPLADTALLAGDILASEGETAAIVDLNDLQPLLYAYNVKDGEEGFDAAVDLNDDKIIDLNDLQALLYNYNSDANVYNAN